MGPNPTFTDKLPYARVLTKMHMGKKYLFRKEFCSQPSRLYTGEVTGAGFILALVGYCLGFTPYFRAGGAARVISVGLEPI